MKKLRFKLPQLTAVLFAVLGMGSIVNAADAPHYVYSKKISTLKVVGSTPVSGGSSSATAPQSSPTAPAVSLSTTTLDFGAVLAGTSNSLAVRLSNTGTASLLFSGAPVLAGASTYSVTTPGGTTCGNSLAPGQSCDTTVVFTPTDTTTTTGSLSFSSNAANSPSVVSLTGTGSPVTGNLAPASASSANFGSIPVGSSSVNSFVFTNQSTTSLTKVAASLSGNADLGFIANTCGSSSAPVTLAAGAACSMTVRYAPSAGSTLTGTLSVASSATNGTQTQVLSGTGVGDPYWSSTNVLLVPFDSNYNDVAGGRVSTAYSGNAGSISLSNTAGSSKSGSALALVNSLGKAGSADANGNGLVIPASTAGNDVFAMGTGNFTVEGWYKWTTFVANKNTKCPGSTYIWTLSGACNISWPIMSLSLGDTTSSSTVLAIALASSTMPSSGPDIAYWATVANVNLNTWYHIALVRNGNVFTVYMNGTPTWTKTVAAGTAMGSVADTARWPAPGFGIGSGYRGQNYAGTTIMAGDGMTGYIDDFRITKGVARYTGAFTPLVPQPQGK